MKMILKIWLALIGLAFFVSCSEQNKEQGAHLQGRTMGTTYNVRYYPQQPIDSKLVQDKIDLSLLQLNQQMSTYIPDSQISQFNKMQSTEPMQIDDGFAYVVDQAIELAKLSQGALDITVGPLVNLWGFGPDKKPTQLPSDQQLGQIDDYVGINKLLLDGNQLSKTDPRVTIDLSAIAKGYGVDVVAEVLESFEIDNYLVEIGGEMRLKGHKPQKQSWLVAIEKPQSLERSVQQVLNVGNNALATSGDYRNYFEQDGIRYSHTIDPITAKPIRHKLASVSVVAENCTLADGWATALNVLGPEKGYKLASELGLAVYLVIKSDEGFEVKYTKAFEPYLVQF
ncbi:thiamine biosynthesis lipoprotein ApbE [Catenovulum agarivorans DS-2]|uniref:FAD:protein FMN transferase n=1 Tax=Catenovulum agarivorans DS-2 TaxID=1328313 RepID=W7QHL5_9ALTE|nr:FAD:protein FMN transferase [Catenovulum agarivorans]EWH11371.1 thiamine biosynthesis lipoprotein ApbE [Catenovulum agarivorans DS-2]